MIILNKYMPEIRIGLSEGLYVFDSQSATGKTRLRKELRKLQQYGESVASYSYEDYQLGMPIDSVLKPSRYKIILLDRYDLYNGEGAERILACIEKCIILIDCKGDLRINAECGWCTIEMTERLIEVIG